MTESSTPLADALVAKYVNDPREIEDLPKEELIAIIRAMNVAFLEAATEMMKLAQELQVNRKAVN